MPTREQIQRAEAGGLLITHNVCGPQTNSGRYRGITLDGGTFTGDPAELGYDSPGFNTAGWLLNGQPNFLPYSPPEYCSGESQAAMASPYFETLSAPVSNGEGQNMCACGGQCGYEAPAPGGSAVASPGWGTPRPARPAKVAARSIQPAVTVSWGWSDWLMVALLIVAFLLLRKYEVL